MSRDSRVTMSGVQVRELVHRAIIISTTGFLPIGAWPGRREIWDALERRGLMGRDLVPTPAGWNLVWGLIGALGVVRPSRYFERESVLVEWCEVGRQVKGLTMSGDGTLWDRDNA